MTQTKEEQIRELMLIFERLPENYQKAMIQFAKNHDYMVEVCKREVLTESVREQLMENAIRDNDALMMILLITERRVNSKA